MSRTRFLTLDDLPAGGAGPASLCALVRVDLNVPMQDGRVSDATRLRAAAPTLLDLAARGAKVLVLAHFGRPKGKRVPDMSLAPVVPALQQVLADHAASFDVKPAGGVRFVEDCIGAPVSAAVADMSPGDIAVLENVRFHPGEEANDPEFAKALAGPGTVYVNDAFSCAHRAHASTEGLSHHLPAYAGRAMAAELAALDGALGSPERPVGAVVGGAKVSTKLDVLLNLAAKVDHLIIGGAMANTFLFAQGHDVGASLHEPDLADTARDVLARAEAAGCQVHLPVDLVVAEKLEAGVATREVPADAIPAGLMALDVGPKTADAYADAVDQCRTLVWNGPLGAFETPPFDEATRVVGTVAASMTEEGQLTTVAGGGDTVAALVQVGVLDWFSYVSTAGGAFLEWLEGRDLPGVVALEQAKKSGAAA